MNAAGRIQGAFAQAVRPLSGVRGTGRLCKLCNRGFLNAGVPPIQIGRMRDGTRMRLDLRSQTEWYAFYSGRYDDTAIELVRRLLSRREGDFLDVGGNIGMYAVRVAAGIDAGHRSVCFEPMPGNAERIRENVRLNGLADRVDIHEIALSDAEGEAELVLREDFEMGSATGNASIAISPAADGRFQKIHVPTRRFDTLLSELGGATFPVVKVDIEGHEDFFLRGASDWLNRQRPIILTEINNWFYRKRGTTSSEVFAATLPENYEVAVLRERGPNPSLAPFHVDALAGLKRVDTCLMYPAEQRDDMQQAAK